jgi:hypothetical protein
MNILVEDVYFLIYLSLPKRERGRPRLTWEEAIKRDLKE